MNTLSPAIKLFLDLAKTQSILTHRFDRGLGGLGFNEFLILFFLSQSEDQKMRRVDLAEKVGMTASGITRLLLPMEKIHLIKSGPAEKDARVRFVKISPAGQEKLDEAVERLEIFSEEIFSHIKEKEITTVSDFLIDIRGKVLGNS